MVSRTYAGYKGKIYTWNDLLEKLNLDVNSNISGRVNFYKQASDKYLKNIKCLTKDDDGEYVEICNSCEELIEDCECGNIYDNDNETEKIVEEETCDFCGALIDDCECEKEIFNDEYIDKKIKRKHFIIQNKPEQEFINNKIKICENFNEPKNINENENDGKLYINTNPYGDVIAHIYSLENNTFVPKIYNNTPCSFILKPGRHVILIRKSGYKTYEKEIIIEKYKTVNIEVGLIKLGKSANYEDINNTQQRELIPQKVKIFVWQRDKGRCVNCGNNKKIEYDHIIPIIKGGSNTERNVQLLCESCNRTKSANI